MIHHELLSKDSVLVLRFMGPLSAGDFAALERDVNPYLRRYGNLEGLVIDVPSFPGWENFQAVRSHWRFVRAHYSKIRRVALISNNKALALVPRLVRGLLNVRIRVFDRYRRAAAFSWVKTGAPDFD